MNVLQVNTWDVAGGAERTAWNLMQSLSARGHSSYLAVGQKRSNDPRVLEIPNDALRDPWARMWRTARLRVAHDPSSPLFNGLASIAEPKRAWNHLRGVDDFDFPGTDHLLQLPPQRPDILHVHNLHGTYFDLRSLPRLSQQAPVVLTLHDAWLLSGHCAHSFDCERWRTGCGHCPDLTIYPAVRRDATAHNWQHKQNIYARSGLYAAVPCHWLEARINHSMLRQAIVEMRVIPHGIDLSVFRPGDKQAARRELNLPQGAWIALFVGTGTRNNRFKDYQTMEAAIRRVASTDNKEIMFVCLGETAEGEQIGAASIRYAGYVDIPEKVAQYYRATDVYLHAARAELWGLSITEALACGSPVIATAVGGIPEQIEDGSTGFLVPVGDSAAMAVRVQQLREDVDLRHRMSACAAESAARRFDLERMVDDYVSWYAEIVEKQQATCSDHSSLAPGRRATQETLVGAARIDCLLSVSESKAPRVREQ